MNSSVALGYTKCGLPFLSMVVLLIGVHLFVEIGERKIHFKLRSITHVATKVHVILRTFAVLTWMSDTIELV